MGDKTGIEWTDATWNPVTGCDKVSPGCDRCYAETFAERWRGTPGHYFENGFNVLVRPDKLDLPLRWSKPRKVFVNSMSDLFHDKVSDEYVASVWAIMALAPQHTFQLLTKRHGRMRALLRSERFPGLVYMAINSLLEHGNPPHVDDIAIMAALDGFSRGRFKVLPNVWLGVSAEDQKRADLRIPALLDTPATVRFVSAEPLLGPINLHTDPIEAGSPFWGSQLDWVIVGGESGPGARPMHPDWARSLRDQCVAAGLPFLFKQWGEWRWTREADDFEFEQARGDLYPNAKWETVSPDGVIIADNIPRPGCATMQRVGKKRAGRELDGRTWDQYPELVTNA